MGSRGVGWIPLGDGKPEADEFSASLAYQVLWTEQPIFVEDAQSDRFFSQQASVRALDSVMLMPSDAYQPLPLSVPKSMSASVPWS